MTHNARLTAFIQARQRGPACTFFERRRRESFLGAVKRILDRFDSGELDGSHYEGMPDGKLEALGYKVGRSDNAPTAQAYAMYDEFVAELEAPFERFQQLVGEAVPAFNRHFQEGGWAAIVL